MKRFKLLAVTVLAIVGTMLPILVSHVSAGVIKASPPALMAAASNSNIAVAQRFYEIYNDRSKLGTLPKLFTPDYVGKFNGRKIPDVSKRWKNQPTLE